MIPEISINIIINSISDSHRLNLLSNKWRNYLIPFLIVCPPDKWIEQQSVLYKQLFDTFLLKRQYVHPVCHCPQKHKLNMSPNFTGKQDGIYVLFILLLVFCSLIIQDEIHSWAHKYSLVLLLCQQILNQRAFLFFIISGKDIVIHALVEECCPIIYLFDNTFTNQIICFFKFRRIIIPLRC